MKRKRLLVAAGGIVVMLCVGIAAIWSGGRRTKRPFKPLQAAAVQPPFERLSDDYDWQPSQFFDDPKVIELCYAMERGDVPAVKKLQAEGVDINARGRGNVTPLLWSTFPLFHLKLVAMKGVHHYRVALGEGPTFLAGLSLEEKRRALRDLPPPASLVEQASLLPWELSPEDDALWKKESMEVFRDFAEDFETWLKLGADPEIPLSKWVSCPMGGGDYPPGSSVYDLAAWNPRRGYALDATVLPIVFKYVKKPPKDKCLFSYIGGTSWGFCPTPLVPKNVALLIEAGANMDVVDSSGRTPLIVAAECDKYDTVYMLLCAGARHQRITAGGTTLLTYLAKSADLYSQWPKWGEKTLRRVAEVRAKREKREVKPEEWKTAFWNEHSLSHVLYFFLVIDRLKAMEPSASDELDRLKKKVEDAFAAEPWLQRVLRSTTYDPYVETWGKARLASRASTPPAATRPAAGNGSPKPVPKAP